MTQTNLLISHFMNKKSLLDLSHDALVSALTSRLTAQSPEDYAITAMAVFGFKSVETVKPFAFVDGIALVPITGVLLNRDKWSDSYATGYDFIRTKLSAAMADPDVKGVIFDVNSPGGMVQGCFELAAEIRAASKIKPSLAVVNANAASGGYALASAAGQIAAIRSADIGSIGVYRMHVDQSKLLEKVGVVVNFVFAGDHKIDGNPYEPLPDSVKKEWQAEVQATYDEFVALVAENRGISEKVVRDTEARVYSAEAAKALGLIDKVASPAEAIEEFVSRLNKSSNVFSLGAQTMTTQNEQGQAVPAEEQAAAARASERSRVSSILNCEAAKGRESLASHLALNTEMSLVDAEKILAAAPVAAKADAPAVAGPVVTLFDQAMAAGNPNIKAQEDDKAEESVSSRILKNFSAATGVAVK